MQWRVFYTGGATFCDRDGSPYDAPTTGVQVIVQPDPDVGRFIINEKDYYWWDPVQEYWFGGDQMGYLQYMLGQGPKMVLFGKLIKWHDYQEVLHRAFADPDFPAKTAGHPRESV